MPFIQNRQKCAYILPGRSPDNSDSILINPGTHVRVDGEHWDHIYKANGKGNRVLEALLSQGLLRATEAEPVDEPVLKSLETVAPPADLLAEAQNPDAVAKVVNKKQEAVSIELDGDGPAEAKTKRRG